MQDTSRADHMAMQARIQACLQDEFTRRATADDFQHTLHNIGMSEEEAAGLAARILNALGQDRPIAPIERSIYQMLARTPVASGDSTPLTVKLNKMLSNRAQTVFGQIKLHFQGVTGPVLDFGAGDGQVTQLLHDRLGLDIVGVDVRDYRADGVNVPIHTFDGRTTEFENGYFQAGLATHVLHHAANNENCLRELTRLVTDKLVIIETVPVGKTDEEIRRDQERTFMNDYLYNRLFHNPAIDVPVPGTYETPPGWTDRFENHGWTCIHSENLGMDMPVIRDTHHLLVFEK